MMSGQLNRDFVSPSVFTLTSLQALRRLSTLLEERGEYYANANARVSLESMYA